MMASGTLCSEHKDSLCTMVELAIAEYSHLPSPFPEFPEIIGLATSPQTEQIGSKTYMIIRYGLQLKLRWFCNGALLRQEDMEMETWRHVQRYRQAIHNWVCYIILPSTYLKNISIVPPLGLFKKFPYKQ